MGSLIFLVLFMVVFWAFLIRPQQKRMREHQELVASIEPGDDVLTNGGLYGTVRNVDGQVVEIEIADGVVVRASRSSIAELIEWDEAGDVGSADDA
jgi:preprotein translocase subunit YajC